LAKAAHSENHLPSAKTLLSANLHLVSPDLARYQILASKPALSHRQELPQTALPLSLQQE
jgi:hypothetical protein